MTHFLQQIGKEPRLMISIGKAYDPPSAASPKADNSNFLSMPTTGLQHYISKPSKAIVLTDAVLPVEHGKKILIMSSTAQATDGQQHTKQQKLNSSTT
jgi:hypothetical protein